MTLKELKFITSEIPDDVILESDSGWECGPTGMDGVYYSKKANIVVFTQGIFKEDMAEEKYNNEYGVKDFRCIFNGGRE